VLSLRPISMNTKLSIIGESTYGPRGLRSCEKRQFAPFCSNLGHNIDRVSVQSSHDRRAAEGMSIT